MSTSLTGFPASWVFPSCWIISVTVQTALLTLLLTKNSLWALHNIFIFFNSNTSGGCYLYSPSHISTLHFSLWLFSIWLLSFLSSNGSSLTPFQDALEPVQWSIVFCSSSLISQQHLTEWTTSYFWKTFSSSAFLLYILLHWCFFHSHSGYFLRDWYLRCPRAQACNHLINIFIHLFISSSWSITLKMSFPTLRTPNNVNFLLQNNHRGTVQSFMFLNFENILPKWCPVALILQCVTPQNIIQIRRWTLTN